jgi:repressor LexA
VNDERFFLRLVFYSSSVRLNIYMAELTARQQEVLDFIRRQQQLTGFPPSSREIQTHFGFQSQTAAMNHLRALQRKGVINRTPGKARSAVDPSFRFLPGLRPIPLLGQIPAGLPTETSEWRGSELGVDLAAFGVESRAEVFAVMVRGDSMIGAQIADGDTVLLQKRAPKNGEIVAALIDGESTLKRYLLNHGEPFLKAENPLYPDLLPAAELVVQGVMIGLLRRVP